MANNIDMITLLLSICCFDKNCKGLNLTEKTDTTMEKLVEKLVEILNIGNIPFYCFPDRLSVNDFVIRRFRCLYPENKKMCPEEIDKRTPEEIEEYKQTVIKIMEKENAMSVEEWNIHFEEKRLEDEKREEDKIKALNYVSEDSEEKQYSILILAADDTTFIEKRWETILCRINEFVNIFKHNIEDYKIYYIGTNLGESLPFRLKGEILHNIPKLDTFDIILNEFCVYWAFTQDVQGLIRDHLKDNGVFVSPDYFRFDFNKDIFQQIGKVDDHMIVLTKR